MRGKIMIPMYRLWLHGLYGLYGPRCPLSPDRPLNLITHSLDAALTGVPLTLTLNLNFQSQILSWEWDLIDIEQKEQKSIGYNTDNVTSRQRLGIGLTRCRRCSRLVYFRNGKVDWLGMKEMQVGYNVGCTMGLLMGHNAWQIHWPSNGSMWNCFSFQPVGPWMGCPFTDLGAEGCCHSLNAFLLFPCTWRIQGWGQFRFCNSNSNSGKTEIYNSNSNSNSVASNSNSNSNSNSRSAIPIPIPFFTRGQFWPSGIVVACVCLCVRSSVRPSVCAVITCLSAR